MKEQETIIENQESKVPETNTTDFTTEKTIESNSVKPIPKSLFIISAAVFAVATIVVLLVLLLKNDPHVHNYGKWETEKEATTTQKGEERSYCSCGEYISRELPIIESKEAKYAQAMALVENKDYEGAYALLLEISDYSPAQKELNKFRCIPIYAESIVEFNGISQTQSATSYIYNELNLPSEATALSGDICFAAGTFSYDERGNLIERILGDYSGNKAICVSTYDNNNNLIIETYTFYDGDKATIEYTYDSNGKLIKKIYKISGENQKVINKTYDTNGKLITEISTYQDGTQSSIENTYDSKGNLIKSVSTDYNGNKEVYDYTYDSKGNLIKRVITNSDNEKKISDYTYNASGLVTKEIYTGFYGDKYIYDYTYDARGNMIKQVTTYPDGYKNIINSTYKFVYVPFEFTDEEWEGLFSYLFSGVQGI